MIRELSGNETGLAYEAMLELRPRIGTREQFVERVNNVQRPESYRLVAVFENGQEQAASVGGFRVLHFLAWGNAMYLDDLSTKASFRGRGHGGQILDWCMAEARRLELGQFHLDSGVGIDRMAAHRLYLNRKMRISSHHFQIDLDQRTGPVAT